MQDIDEGGHVFKDQNISKDETRNIFSTNSNDTIPAYLPSHNKENIHNFLNIKNFI